MSRSLTILTTFFLALAFVSTSIADIWDGPSITFTKDNFADWTDPANQDFLTPNVILTRADIEGLFNFATEQDYNPSPFSSPDDTEWAFGTTADIGSLTFTDWATWHGGPAGGGPLSTIGQAAVLHLISDDIYIDIMFTSWTAGGGGGGFSYIRSTPGAIPEPASALACVLLSGMLLARRVR